MLGDKYQRFDSRKDLTMAKIVRITAAAVITFALSSVGSSNSNLLAAVDSPSPLTMQKSPNAACCIGNVFDDFSDGSLAPYWFDGLGCGNASVTNGALEINQPDGCGQFAGSSAFLASQYRLCGDFDVQLDFNLVYWPMPAGGRYASLVVYDPSGSELFVI